METKKIVIDDISDAALFDLSTDNPVAFFDRLQQLNFQIPASQTRVYGGTSKYAFHLTENDAEGSVSATNAQLDLNALVAATGATVSTGSTVVPEVEKKTVESGGTITLTNAATMVSDSEKVVVATKGLTNSGVILERVEATPTAAQYTIAAGVITPGDATLVGKDLRVFYDYTATSGTKASVKTTTKNKPYMFKAYGRFFDDELDVWVKVRIILYKTQMLGTFSIDQQRKTATTNSIEFAILDPQRSDGNVIDIILV